MIESKWRGLKSMETEWKREKDGGENEMKERGERALKIKKEGMERKREGIQKKD